MNIGPGWTDERIQTLKDWQVMGLSAAQIAIQMDVSRNSIIGKLNRLGIVGRKPIYTPRPKVERRAPLVVRKLAPAPKPEPELTDLPADQSAVACTIADLSDDRCHWPLGSPAHDMLYCGAPTKRVYCDHHHAVAYRPLWRRA